MKNETHNMALIEQIYSAGLGEVSWGTVITNINDSFSSSAGGMFIQNDQDQNYGEVLMTGFPNGCMEIYEQYYHSVNPWFSIPGMMEPNCIRTEGDIDIYKKKNGAFNRMEFFNDWMNPYELHHAIGGSLTTRGPLHLNFTMFRPKEIGAYRGDEISRLETLYPHLRRAMEVCSLREAATSHNRTLLEGMDEIGVGVVLIGNRKSVIEMNQSANTVLNAADGLAIKQNQVTITHKETRKLFDNMVEHSDVLRASHQMSSISRWLYVPRPSSKADYQLLMIYNSNPLSIFHAGSITCTFLIIDPATRQSLPRKIVQNRFKLTERETDVAQLLLAGKTTRQLAQELEITYQTARTYTKQVCQKANARTQTEFVACVFSELSLIVCAEAKTSPSK